MRQVKMPSWRKGNVVLTGDAAWYVTPMGEVGATLAVVGAYILAGELSKTDLVFEALAPYEERLRDFVENAQNIPKLAPRLANPQSHFGLAVLHGTSKVASAPGVRDLFGKFLAGKAKEIDLPDYTKS